MTIHVFNLPLNLIESDLYRLFSPFGEVRAVELVRDKINNRSRGRAFIDMPVDLENDKAMANLNGKEILGKIIKVLRVTYDPSHSTHLFSSKL